MTAVEYIHREARDLPPEAAWLATSEIRALSALRIEKRRRDWLLGRLTAKQAVAARLGLAADSPGLQRIEVLAAEDGAPEPYLDGARAELELSISHCEGRGLAATAPRGICLGCDMERVRLRERSFVETFFTQAEVARVDSVGATVGTLLATVIWSAKESVLKAQRVGLRADTRSVELVEIALDGLSGWRPLKMRHAGSDRRFSGWWRQDGREVLTVVADPAPSVPRLSCGA